MPIRVEDRTTDINEAAYVVLATEEAGEVLWAFSRSFIARDLVDCFVRFIGRLEPSGDGVIFLLPAHDKEGLWGVIKSRRGELDTRGALFPLYLSKEESLWQESQKKS